MYRERERLTAQRQIREMHRQDDIRRVEEEQQLLAGMRDEASAERKRYQRQVEQELQERETEAFLQKVCQVDGPDT